jgi:L-amino acid N-acyltransferase YncA
MRSGDVPLLAAFFDRLREEKAIMSFVDAEITDLEKWSEDPLVFCYVVEVQGEVVGLIKAKRPGRPNQRFWAFLSIAIDTAHRGMGLARGLTDFACQRLREEGIWLVRAYIYNDNAASLATARACGFVETGRVVAHHRDEETGQLVDDVIMHRIIGEEGSQ